MGRRPSFPPFASGSAHPNSETKRVSNRRSAMEQRFDSRLAVFARLTGCLYLSIIVIGFWVEVFVRGRIIVPGNASATAHNLATHEMLWRLGFGGEATMWLFSVVTMTVFYILFRPIDPIIALMALLFNVIVPCDLAALARRGAFDQHLYDRVRIRRQTIR